jgi:peptide/nickel transport system substrate-binding protein
MLETVFKNWDFDATVQTNGTSGDPSLGISRAYTSSAMTRGNFTNASGYSTPQVDDLFEKGATQPTNEQRAPFFFQIQEILAEDVPTLPLLDQSGVDVARNNFEYSTSIWTQNKTYGGWQGVWKKS